jgi:hypothetical protein
VGPPFHVARVTRLVPRRVESFVVRGQVQTAASQYACKGPCRSNKSEVGDRPNLPKPLLKRLLHEDINARQVVREPLPHIARFCSILGARAVRVKGVLTLVGIGSRE